METALQDSESAALSCKQSKHNSTKRLRGGKLLMSDIGKNNNFSFSFLVCPQLDLESQM